MSRPPDAWFQVSKQILKGLWHGFRMTPCIWASDFVLWSCGPVPRDGPIQAWPGPCPKNFASPAEKSVTPMWWTILWCIIQKLLWRAPTYLFSQGLTHCGEKFSTCHVFFFFTSPWWALSESDCSQTSISRPPGAWFQVSKRILKALWHSFRMTPCIWASDIVGLSCGPVPPDGPVQAWSSPAKMTKLHQLGQVWPQCDGPFCNAPFCSSVDDLWGERTLTSLSHWCEKLCTFNQTPFWAKMEVQLVPPKIQIWTQSGLPWGSHGVWGLQGPLLGHEVKV